ncbi:MAG: FAD-dependent oxidoreductase [Candidatus Eremiobacteraeota bacterium]|nr:FAD-dependent oxidoreductase [Candidatus Eremiobacteraeota bacterium]
MATIACRAVTLLSVGVLSLVPYAARAQSVRSPDLLVVGATPAGIAAAVTAARAGETVMLTSATGDIGGTLTGAMMDQWDLNVAPDGSALQGGIFAEIRSRLGDAFSPRAARRTFASMLTAQPRISLRYGEVPISTASSADHSGRRVDGVTFRDTRSGRLMFVHAPAIIDATDSADVAVLAGARYDIGRQDTGVDEREQAVTEVFTVSGVNWTRLAESYQVRRYGHGGAGGRRAWGYARLLRRYRPASRDIIVRDLNFGLMSGGAVSVNAIDVCGINGLAPRALERAKRETQREAPRLVAFLRHHLRGFERAQVGMFAPSVYVRETRHIAGLERLTAQAVWLGHIPSDSIGLASYPLDLHPIVTTDEPAFATKRHVYGVPFGALVPSGFTNILLASPAISASHVASGSVRTIPTTVEEGEADALASVLARRTGLTFPELAAQPRRLVVVRRATG